jgi:hypothetical protein
MAEQFEFELVFGLPAGEFDPLDLSDSVFGAGYEDAVIGTGNPKLLAIELEASGDEAEAVILAAARTIIANLPPGTELREVRPDLVSLADVAEKLEVTRQTLQQREMPPPVAGGMYRIDEIADVIERAEAPVGGKRRPRFRAEAARKWFRGGKGARTLNAKLTLKTLNPRSLRIEEDGDRPRPRA